ncbi:hypothetical protein [Polaribacter cellanae]|uniref:Uncharacterized protein n=1 Tax=Polaribacter cellanae TaxID=2818493 RepID=A0A975CM06_9FLAO|nr:hypothetical protein [Polaribacter cellanae]QTE21547.1 hypothetical protein J3359_12025 [Polaribacter cellanae]
MTLILKKKAIIDWISFIEDKDVLNQIFEYQQLKNKNFKKDIENAITVDEVREQTDTYIKSLDWKK